MSDKAPPGYRLTARGWAGSIFRQLVDATSQDECVKILNVTVDKIIKEAYKRGYDEGWSAAEMPKASEVSGKA